MASSSGYTSPAIRLLDFVLLLYFLFLSASIPFVAAHVVLSDLIPFPPAVTDLIRQYADDSEDPLLAEKPYFFRGMVWFELFVLWPISLAGFYAGVARKPWFREVCLVAGILTGTSMSAIVAEVLGSGSASRKLIMMYAPNLVCPALAILRRLLPCPASSKDSPPVTSKKTA